MTRLLSSLMFAGVILALPAAAQSQAPSPLLGTWQLDVARMPFPPEKRPKAVTITYSDAGQGKWRTTLEVTGGDGSPIRAEGTYPLDGTAAPSQGYPGVDMLATRVPASNVMVAAFYKDHMPRTTRTYVVAADGKTMTETVVWLNLNGQPEITTSYFNRAR
ncbi:hypothetical protein Q9Q95_08580 [Sphingomonas sp. DG1-23]|uniref:hypothetical protein n=1 Tax=Sphingomonas sp. DG1-23 TaxID=3068316 RepID=UPI00273D2C97|nr:hypothetical protein [Sphingomonas sp. DG1-23]MDP5278976.1 hypothetical protein [Sphingomonas sp. DG1-23]